MPIYLRYAIFLTVLGSALFGVSFYVFRRLSADWQLGERGRSVLKVVLGGSIVLMLGTRIIERAWPSPVLHMVGVLGSVVVVGALVTFAILLVHGLLRWIARRLTRKPASPEEPVDVGRRDVLSKAVATGAVVLGGGSSTYGAVLGRHDYVIEEAPVRLARLPRELDGFTLVQLSDLHIGLDVGERELSAALDLVTQARPDHIVLTGDLIDHDVRFVEELGRFARRLGERAAVSAVIGNHDYYTGIAETIAVLRRAGVNVMVNESQILEGKLALGGVDDVWAERELRGRGPDVERAFAGVDPELARVLLCHNPSYYPDAADHVDLQLSGHTHGGQFSPLVNPARLVLRHGYIRGHYERARGSGDRTEAKSQLYVNRGFGTAGPPARIGSPPEVTKIILTS